MKKPRILIVRFSAIGDCVMSAWAVTSLRQALPGAMIAWAVQERCAPVVDPTRLVDHRLMGDMDAWRKNRKSPATWRAQVKLFLELRKFQFDVGFDLQGHSKTALCLRFSGAKTRLTNRSTDPLARRMNTLIPPSSENLHEVERALELISHKFPVQAPDLPIMPEVDSQGPRDLITIQTGAGGQGKAYGIEHFRAVAQNLAELGHQVVGVGGPNDPRLNLDGVRDTAGELSLGESMGLIKASKLHLASDTGTGHIASAYGIPTVSVFGPMPAQRYRPWGERAVVLDRGTNPNDVPVEDVMAACMGQLERSYCAS